MVLMALVSLALSILVALVVLTAVGSLSLYPYDWWHDNK